MKDEDHDAEAEAAAREREAADAAAEVEAATDDDADAEDVADARSYRDRIAILPGEPRIAYRPRRFLLKDDNLSAAARQELTDRAIVLRDVFSGLTDAERSDLDETGLTQWKVADNVDDAPSVVTRLRHHGATCHLDIVYFANTCCCGFCPPHPSLATSIAANPWGANPWGANPWGANPWGANPWGANPWGANPWGANAEALNLVATGKPPMSSAMPASEPSRPDRGSLNGTGIRIGVLDSGLAGWWHGDQMRPKELQHARIHGARDLPSAPMPAKPNEPADRFLDPVAGHGTFIAGLVEERTPGCTINVRKVFEPEGDVSVKELAPVLHRLIARRKPAIVNFSFGGTGTTEDGLFESVVRHFHRGERGVVFVGAAGNDGTCIEQYPAALPEVIAVGALGPNGPAPWSNYGPWLDASAPGTDLVSSFFANFDGDLPPINGLDPDNFTGWATWSGTSFAAPVVVAALAREMATTTCTAKEAVERVIRAPHLARLPNMGTIVNY